ncbi:MAG: carbon storage regulator, partial [Planctomycetes bacterium]|nr:carbon storage regulator [Planctomycetota bacterium]
MLVLSRRPNEKILLPSIQTTIEVVSIKPGAVRLGIKAPAEVAVLREEVYQRTAEWGQPQVPAADPTMEARLREVVQLLQNRLTIASKGLVQAQEQLQAGCTQKVEVILDHLEEDLQLLQRRLEGKFLPPEKKVKSPSKAARVRRALLVEDDQNERELLAGLLRMAGIEVDTAGDGIDALNHLRDTNRPEVVLMDMGLPRCDGASTVRQIRRDPAYAGLKIFAVSGSTPDQFDLDQ